MDWEDIRVSGLDESKTQRIAGGMWEVHFLLSESTPREWQNAFVEITKGSFDSQKRRADARAESVIVRCPYEEIEHQLETLKGIVTDTNARYREILAEAERQEDRAEQVAEGDRARLEDLRSRLKFD